MIVKMIKMDFLHKSSVGSELSICIYISSSAIVRIREHVKQVESSEPTELLWRKSILIIFTFIKLFFVVFSEGKWLKH